MLNVCVCVWMLTMVTNYSYHPTFTFVVCK